MKLYELTQEEKHLNDLFLSAIDEETGEIKDPQVLEALEKEFKTALATKSAGIIKALRQQEAYIETVDAEIERLKAVKERMKKGIEGFKHYIKYNMAQMDIKKIETPLGNLSLRQTTATDVYDESVLPKEFLKEKITYTPSKTDIKKALQNGEEVPGARLVVNTNLNIK